MTEFDYLNGLAVTEDIVTNRNQPTLNFMKEEAGFRIFNFLDSKGRPFAIGDEADYLELFMKIAENIYRSTGSSFVTQLIASDMGGHHLFLRDFTGEDREKHKYAHVSLLHALKELSAETRPGTFSFFGELNLVDASEEQFGKESKKTARTLSGKNLEKWQEIADSRCNFLKTDLYVYSLLKLFSWGFQAIDATGEIREERNLIRPKRPKPRGASRK